ncbi:DUF6712 family protein [Hymenobacter algoricola]|uniref:Uncharacterized protein n=1 Tax=Hymenobacter algoricola TaxID=486267 RepID=A0ABP7NTX4_9BACT
MLLTTDQELARYVRLDSNDFPDVLPPEIERLEQQLLQPVLGTVLLTWLQAQYDAGVAAGSVAAQLLGVVQAPLARLAVAGVAVELQMTISSTGIQIVSTATHKTAFQWQTKALEKTLLRKGHLDMVELLRWLEANRDASDELRAWAAGPGQDYRQQLLVSAEEFSYFENISNSWPVFEALKPLMRRQELFILESQLGPEFLQELRDQVRTRALSVENEALMQLYVRPALASLTLARAVPELGLRLTGDGIELMVARIDDSNEKEADAGLDQLLAARAHEAQRAADIMLEKMRAYLARTASATKYATYFASKPPTPEAIPLNTVESRVYRLI